MESEQLQAEQDIQRWRENAKLLDEKGLYDPASEHGSCGVGVVVSLDGTPKREVVTAAIEALKCVWHRGAVDADGKTGDGAGIHVQIPQPFFRDHVVASGFEPGPGKIAVGMIFLPRTDLAAQERCRVLVEREIIGFGYRVYGWRQVPVHTEVIGEKANVTRPEIEQLIVGNQKGLPSSEFELELYIMRRRIEKAAHKENIRDFYICSLSCRSIIYKGMFVAEQLTAFYPDLADERFVSNFAIFHQRYSTNTFPTWQLAQPFRVIAHNGEINTLRGNLNWMMAHETRLEHARFGAYIEDCKPIVTAGSSDSAALDAVFEVMTRAGRHLPACKAMLMPEAWSSQSAMSPELKGFYGWSNSVIEPWDGPAAVCGYGGRWVVAGMDRNGLRPMRWTLTKDGLLFAGSEAGMVRLEEERVLEKGRLGPGQMLAVDLEAKKFYHDAELKAHLASLNPYHEWVRDITPLDALIRPGTGEPTHLSTSELRVREACFAWSHEDLELILQPLVQDAKEAIGSMGDDTPLAVLSDKYRGLHHFFRQNFAQVTNPPLDSLRERRVMSIRTRLGNLGNILAEDPSQCRLLQLESPVLSNAEFAAMRAYMGATAVEIDATFPVAGGEQALRDALARMREEAAQSVRNGREHVILSDEKLGADRAAVPMILATGAVHVHLLRQNLRTFTSLNVRSAECLDSHYFAVLIGVGATTVNAWLAQEAIADRHSRGLFAPLTLEACVGRYKKAIDDGLLKIISKMGISVISAYRGGCNFEALGLSRTLVDEYLPGMPSRLSGIGLSGIAGMVVSEHKKAFDTGALPIGGFYRAREGGERHAWDADAIHLLQTAVATDSLAAFRKYSQTLRNRPPVNLRDLLDFNPTQPPVPIDEIESLTSIRKRFITPGMSLGALSPEAHETLNIAMNRIGARSDSGEGGEDPARFRPYANGDNPNSAIKQVASGRFGVTMQYLQHCKEIEIKIAQGAKPGEGGQLPGFKVTEMIGRLRHATPGVTLISPPPHHDIYSIEDLAQLIYDLKQANPDARVCVKLVSRSGIGTVAAGVAKAKADVILISGHNGGTGASPQTSLHYAGLPWELGLSEANQVLTLNRLRHRMRLRADGGIRTGRDVVVAALLGAEEFGIGTASLIAMGCLMVRQCHSNTCPVGVCTQDEKLRAKFTGNAEKVVNLFSFIAEETREIMAKLGIRHFDDLIGRTDLLKQVSRGAVHLDDLDLNPLLVQADAGGLPRHCVLEGRNEVPDGLDGQMLADAGPLVHDGEKMQLQYAVRNTHRAVGTRLSAMITRKFGMTGLKPGHVTVRLRGSAGQSLGAWAVQGLKLEVFGDANDYVGKGLSGGFIVVRPPAASSRPSEQNTIIGNVALYGATSGTLYAAGQAGERFAVRNSGATAVVEGCGSNGCEYMTGGDVVILGDVGDNFAAGMTGGTAWVWDPNQKLAERTNHDTVLLLRPDEDHMVHVRGLIEGFVAETNSRYAAQILTDWDQVKKQFWRVWPRELAQREIDAAT